MPDNKPEKPSAWEQFWFSLTPNDQKAILRARKKLEVDTSQTRLVDRKTGRYPDARAAIHQKIVQEFVADVQESERPWATIIIGPPSSGKNTFLTRNPEFLKDSILIDNDEMKARLPGFHPALAAVYHQESEYIETLLYVEAMSHAKSFVMLRVGKNTKSMASIILDLKEGGYRVRLILLDLDPTEAARRAMRRFAEGGRYVDPEYIISEVALTPLETYVTLKSEVDEYARYSAQEAPPRLTEQGP